MPQRFLRPGIRTSEAWNRTSYSAQSLYISLLTLVDDFGRYDGRSALIHGECRILRNDSKPQQTAADLRQLHEVGLIQLYDHEDKKYLQVLKWQERSRADHSKYPSPPQDSAANRSIPQEKDASLVPRSSPSPSPVGKLNFPNGLTDSEWLSQLVQDKTYQGIDVMREHGKLVNWCKTNQKSPTRRRFVNWLNRAERPMQVMAKEKRKESLW